MTGFFCLFLVLLQSPPQTDSLASPFNHNNFLKRILTDHPLAKQAGLRNRLADAALQRARGSFDPVLESSYDEKDFDGKDYYAILNSYATWQSPYAASVKAGYERQSGVFVNPENNTPSGGLWFAGISVPLLQGLRMDEARAGFFTARISAEALENERLFLLNNLALQASVDYWSWYENAMDLSIDREGVVLATDRFSFMLQSFRSGDRAAIDTLEAFIQLQQRQLGLAERIIAVQKSSAVLSGWLRAAGDSLSRPEYAFPESDSGQSALRAASGITNNPEYRAYRFKAQQLEIEQKLKQEKLKPQLDAEYAFLSGDAGLPVSSTQQAGRKLGVDFKLPMLLRTARGDVAAVRIKRKEITLQQEAKLQELQAKFEGFSAETSRLQEQILAFETAVRNYGALLEAERTRFLNGESSVFLVNQRENAYLESRKKLVQLRTKYQISLSGLRWTAGVISGI